MKQSIVQKTPIKYPNVINSTIEYDIYFFVCSISVRRSIGHNEDKKPMHKESKKSNCLSSMRLNE